MTFEKRVFGMWMEIKRNQIESKGSPMCIQQPPNAYSNKWNLALGFLWERANDVENVSTSLSYHVVLTISK